MRDIATHLCDRYVINYRNYDLSLFYTWIIGWVYVDMHITDLCVMNLYIYFLKFTQLIQIVKYYIYIKNILTHHIKFYILHNFLLFFIDKKIIYIIFRLNNFVHTYKIVKIFLIKYKILFQNILSYKSHMYHHIYRFDLKMKIYIIGSTDYNIDCSRYVWIEQGLVQE